MNYTKENKITIEEIDSNIHLFAGSRTQKRIPEILKMRLAGTTLENIGNLFELTRERIRHQEIKGCQMLANGGMCEPARIEEKVSKEIRQENIKNSDLSSRTIQALQDESVHTIGGLMRKTEYNLLCVDRIGEKSIQEIKAYLQSFGVELKKT